MTHQGKFNILTKELITYVLGFKEDEENFVRSEQFVLSNLLYHHCLAVNSHAIRRSIDGLCLKFTVHGQANRAQRLNDLTSRFLQSPLFKEHYETDIEWSLLSLLLHLSNSPTQVPETEAELYPVIQKNASPASSQDLADEQIDWVSYLLKGEKERVFGPEDPLSDWSDSDEEDYLSSRRNTISYKSYNEEELFIKTSSKNKNKNWNLLEQSHRARSWISGNTQIPYWKGKCYQHEVLSSRLIANVASVWEEAKRGERSQQLSEWVIMREVLWVLMCPVTSHIFQRNEKGDFIVKTTVTLPSLTHGATTKLLEDLCTPLKQLDELDSFMRNLESPEVIPPTPVTLLAYATGLRQWRRHFQVYLSSLENIVKKQESTATMIWLMNELKPWLRILSSIYAVHYTAVIEFPEDSSRKLALRLIGSLCESVEIAGEADLRCVLLRLLLHTMRHYFSIMHNWLVHGSLIDFANEFIIERNESISVMDESFWREAFSVDYHPESKELAPGDPLKTGVRILLPLALALSSIGKSQELLSALTMKPFQIDSVKCLASAKAHAETEHLSRPKTEPALGFSQTSFAKQAQPSVHEKPLEEMLVEHVSKLVMDGVSVDEPSENLEEVVHSPKKNTDVDVKNTEKDSSPTKAVTDSLTHTQQHESNILHIQNILDLADPMLVDSCDETQEEDTLIEQKDILERKIEAIIDVPRTVSVVGLLSSSMRPLITKKQNELNVKLTDTLIREHQLDRHCKVVCSILLMEAGDVMHEFYSHIFNKVDHGDGVDSVSLTLHLEYCISRMYPDLAKYFSVSVEGKDSEEDEKKDSEGRLHTSIKRKEDTTSQQLSALGLPNVNIHYEAPWPMNLLFTEEDMTKFNMLFRFSLSLKRATYGLERLKFKDMASWNVLVSAGNTPEESDSPLQSRLHRLQLLRLWLLCFARELHNYFANVVFLPYYQAFEDLVNSKPSFSTIIAGHSKLLNRVVGLCFMGNDTKISPLQVVLSKVFWLTQQLGHLWVKDIVRVTSEELSSLETQYVQVHRYLVNLLGHLTTTRFLPHLEGMTRTLANTVPLHVM